MADYFWIATTDTPMDSPAGWEGGNVPTIGHNGIFRGGLQSGNALAPAAPMTFDAMRVSAAYTGNFGVNGAPIAVTLNQELDYQGSGAEAWFEGDTFKEVHVKTSSRGENAFNIKVNSTNPNPFRMTSGRANILGDTNPGSVFSSVDLAYTNSEQGEATLIVKPGTGVIGQFTQVGSFSQISRSVQGMIINGLATCECLEGAAVTAGLTEVNGGVVRWLSSKEAGTLLCTAGSFDASGSGDPMSIAGGKVMGVAKVNLDRGSDVVDIQSPIYLYGNKAQLRVYGRSTDKVILV